MELYNRYYPVLDHGFVALKEMMGNDESIVEAARVSYGKGTKTINDNRALIRYLVRNRHTTPLECVVYKFHIAMPIHVHRQHIRHRCSTTNEVSYRYSEVPEKLYHSYKFHKQSKNNKQGRDEYGELPPNLEVELKNKILYNESESFKLYHQLLDLGVAREIARMHLPLNVYTYFYWKIDLHNLMYYLKLRTDPHAQYEIRQYANLMAGIMKATCPVAFEAWNDYVYNCAYFSKLDRLLVDYMLSNSINDEKDIIIQAKQLGMSGREIEEFLTKIKSTTERDFTLSTIYYDPSFYDVKT